MPASSHAEGTKLYSVGAIPRIFSDWRVSSDGKIAVCFALDKTTFGPKETVTLRCALRNLSDKPITILRPFGDRYLAEYQGLLLLGPDGPVPFLGGGKEYALGPDSFVEIPPKMAVDGSLVVRREVFPKFGAPGLYTLGYQFESQALMYHKAPAPENLWEGKLSAGTVSLQIKKPVQDD